MHPTTRYTKSGDVHVAYQVFGTGPVDIVFVPGFVSHIDNYWDEPNFARALLRLGKFARVVMFDKRGTGLSDRVDAPAMDQRMDDIRAVMDAEKLDRASILGISEGGSLASLFAAHHPERCQALVLYGAFARFASWIPSDDALEEFIQYIDNHWGSGESVAMFVPSMAEDSAFRKWWGKYERFGANPGAAITIMRMNSQIDVTDALPAIRVPTLVLHRTDDVSVDVQGGRELAESIPNAKYVELAGSDHFFATGENRDQILREIEEFLTGSKPEPVIDRVLATILISDIVESTSQAEELGDQRWQDLMEDHNRTVRAELERFRGTEIRFTGDGFLATFDGPARTIHCAIAIAKNLQPLGIQVRFGLHTGEVEFSDGEIHGIAVNTTARISAIANAGEILVSRTVKDLVAGSGIQLAHHGRHRFKGLTESMDVYSVED